MFIEKDYAVSTHQPLIKLMAETYKPTFIMELGIGIYSTPLLMSFKAKKLFVESSLEWIEYMKPHTKKEEVIYHAVKNEHHGCAVPEPLAKEIKDYYKELSKRVPDGLNMLFVDNYSCCRTIAIQTLQNCFDIIVYHDCEPEGARVNGYKFDLPNHDNFVLHTPKTWAGCFINKRLNPNIKDLQNKIMPILNDYLIENQIIYLQ
jgi:hypothetical protein